MEKVKETILGSAIELYKEEWLNRKKEEERCSLKGNQSN